MVRVNAGKPSEVTLRLVLESEPFGREYFDQYRDIDELLEGLKRLLYEGLKAVTGGDEVERTISVAIVPRSGYGDETGYGYGLSAEDA